MNRIESADGPMYGDEPEEVGMNGYALPLHRIIHRAERCYDLMERKRVGDAVKIFREIVTCTVALGWYLARRIRRDAREKRK